ncbi:MAG: hypothetical protein PHD51_03590 [Patescibacteria group bacterium]|nr:hypothetical protein [Patescibacteria group bacterium]MDD5490944.1 hypothetical protein [Patescibacteria group bacterium]
MKRNLYLFKKWLKLDKKPLLLLAIFIMEFLFPQVSVAKDLERFEEQSLAERAAVLEWPICEEKKDCEEREFLSPDKELKKPKKVFYVVVTAYTSTPDQTDSTPCVTASGLNVCARDKENVVAANFLRFGTKVKIPEVFGEQVFHVEDRMNPRYTYRVDVWMKSREAAEEFGVKKVKVEVY